MTEAADTEQVDQDDLNDLDAKDNESGDKIPRTKCQRLREHCGVLCRPCMTKHNTLAIDATRCERFSYAFLCPPHGNLARIVTLVISGVLIWALLWSITGTQALPGGNFFGILVLLICSLIGGYFVQLIHLPPLLGMLLVGFGLRNIPYIDVAKDIDPDWASSLRTIALAVILIRAGLGLDPTALRKLSCVVIRLAFLPCLFECLTVAIATHELFSFPWEWGFMLGFVLAAVSPAVVVPCLLSLQERGYGVDQGIPTLVIAAASIDDVLAISGFGVLLGIVFSNNKGGLALTIVRGPLEAVAGILFGILGGIVLWYFPGKTGGNKLLYRTILLLFGGLFSIFGSQAAEIPGAGALGCLTIAFVAGLRWRKEGWTDDESPIADVMSKFWWIFQPLLFGLIGAEVQISKLDGPTIGLGVATLGIGLVIRIIVSFISVFGTQLTLRERIFIPFAWLPKATVQAAIGPVALDMARKNNAGQEQLDLGIKVLTIAVLVIIITAPIGAVAISLLGPRLLRKSEKAKFLENADPRISHTTNGRPEMHELISKQNSEMISSCSSDFITQDSMERMSANV